MCVLFSSSYGVLGKMYKKSETSPEIGLETLKVLGTDFFKKARLIKDDLIFRSGIFSTHIISELNYHSNFLTILPTSSLVPSHLRQPIFSIAARVIDQWFSKLSVHQNGREGLLKQIAGPTPRGSASAGPG